MKERSIFHNREVTLVHLPVLVRIRVFITTQEEGWNKKIFAHKVAHSFRFILASTVYRQCNCRQLAVSLCAFSLLALFAISPQAYDPCPFSLPSGLHQLISLNQFAHLDLISEKENPGQPTNPRPPSLAI